MLLRRRAFYGKEMENKLKTYNYIMQPLAGKRNRDGKRKTYSNEFKLCTSCASEVCKYTCGKMVFTVMWIGRPMSTFTCFPCWRQMFQCVACCAWSKGISSRLCVRCSEKYCSMCYNVSSSLICSACVKTVTLQLNKHNLCKNLLNCIVKYLT